MNIGYLTEPVAKYVDAVGRAETLEDLHHVVDLYKLIAGDALAAVEKMDSEDFERWRAGIALERRKIFAGEEFCEKYGMVLMPLVMLEVGLVAQHFGAPWGCAFIRMKEEGAIVEKDGVASIVRDPKPKKSKRRAVPTNAAQSEGGK